MEAASARAKGVVAVAKNAVVVTRDHLVAETDVHSPAAPLRSRKNMAEVVVDEDFHSYQKNALLQHPAGIGGPARVALIRTCSFAEQSFKLLWTNASKAELSNVHKREKGVLLHVSSVGVTIERTDTKKAESLHGPFDWWQIVSWEVGKWTFSFSVRTNRSAASTVLHFATRNSFGGYLHTSSANVGRAFTAATSTIAERLTDAKGRTGQLAQGSTSTLAAETGDHVPVFSVARSPSRQLATKPTVLSNGGLSPPPKSRLSKRSGSKCTTAVATAVQSPTRPFAQSPCKDVLEPRLIPEPEQLLTRTRRSDGATTNAALLTELFSESAPAPASPAAGPASMARGRNALQHNPFANG